MLEHGRAEAERRVRRRLPVANGSRALPAAHDRSSECSSSTLAAAPGAIHWTDVTHSSDSWSSESLGITAGSGSDSTDFTPGEFHDYLPRRRHPPRPASNGSSAGTLHAAGGGPYVARITVTAPTDRSEADTLVVPLVRQGSVVSPVVLSNHREPSATLSKTVRKNDRWNNSPISAAEAMEPRDASAVQRKTSRQVSVGYPTNLEDNSVSSTSPIRSWVNRNEVVELIAQPPEFDASPTKMNSRSTSKHLQPMTNGGHPFTLPVTERINRHPKPLQITHSELPTPQKYDVNLSSKYPPKPKNDGTAGLVDKNYWLSLNSAAEREASEQRIGMRAKHAKTKADYQQTTSRSSGVVDRVVEGRGKPMYGEDEVLMTNDAGRRQSLPGKRSEVVPRRASTGDPIIRDAAFHRSRDSGATNAWKQVGASAVCAPDIGDVPSQVFRRTDPKATATPVNIKDTGMGASRTLEPSAEEDRRRKDKKNQMKRYCLEQLAMPSSSTPELANRRRNKLQRKAANRTPSSQDGARTLKFSSALINAPTSSREYASPDRQVGKYSFEDADDETSLNREYSSPRGHLPRRKYSSYTTTTSRDSFPARMNNIGKNSPETFMVEKTEPPPHTFRHIEGITLESQTLDRRRSRQKKERRRSARPSPEENVLSSVSSAANTRTFSQSGRLSITITSNEPEPEIVFPSRHGSKEKTYRNQMYVVLADGDVTNRKFHEGEDTLPSDEDVGWKSSSSEATISGGVSRGESVSDQTKNNFRRHARRISTASSCVDAAVQVEEKELKPRKKDAASRPPTSDSGRALRDNHCQTASSDLDRTAADGESPTGLDSPTSESSSSSYFRRSGKDVWRASMALHRSRRDKDTAETRNEGNGTPGQSSTVMKSNRRRHRHSVASFETNYAEHPGSSRLRNGHDKKTEDAVAVETAEMNRRNAMEKIRANERYVEGSGRNGNKLVELLQIDEPGPARGCPKNVKEVASTVLTQPTSSPSLSLDSSSIAAKVANDEGKERDSIRGQTADREIIETRPQNREKASDDQSRPIPRRRAREIGTDETSLQTGKVITNASEPRSQTAKLAQNHDPKMSSELQSSPDYSVTSAIDKALLVDDSRPIKDVDDFVIDKPTASADVSEKARTISLAKERKLVDHDQRDRSIGSRPASQKTGAIEASTVATHEENFHPGNSGVVDMTSADNESHSPSDILYSCSDVVLQQVRSLPERTTFISRFINRWT